jgi:hypothetical protein
MESGTLLGRVRRWLGLPKAALRTDWPSLEAGVTNEERTALLGQPLEAKRF